jgi:hypothetical protein
LNQLIQTSIHNHKQTIICEKLGILAPFEGVCFGHALFKLCQYANEKVSSSLQPMNIKYAQFLIQACITWQKKSRK